MNTNGLAEELAQTSWRSTLVLDQLLEGRMELSFLTNDTRAHQGDTIGPIQQLLNFWVHIKIYQTFSFRLNRSCVRDFLWPGRLLWYIQVCSSIDRTHDHGFLPLLRGRDPLLQIRPKGEDPELELGTKELNYEINLNQSEWRLPSHSCRTSSAAVDLRRMSVNGGQSRRIKKVEAKQVMIGD
ncbi:hypothetical protein Nepgr_019420 [Nepenthes gracilis]|uniref:Uncharacterized protein n=1 Tax=Nepenthes gracilis TaxID=150966 RepID=A0AAD3XV03_NEPGR|nr:hypothetical protein Nepgr_019420 [Nepenthes gracilis]